MKRTLRVLIAAMCAALMLCALFAVAACGPREDEGGKEEGGKTAALTLDAGEGTVANGNYEVEVGSDLFEFLKDKTPTPPEGLTFAGWYLGNAPIEKGTTMSESGASVTAKYYAEYTLEIYLEGDGGFQRSEENSKTSTAFYGEPLTLELPSIAHYALDAAHEGSKTASEKLGKDEVFKAYYALATYTVIYDAAAPADAGLEGNVSSAEVRYGGEVTLEGGEAYVVAPQYRFAGWAETKGGPVKYQKGDKIKPEDNVVLYGVWDTACKDRFGGSDLLFFPQADEDAAVLVRAGEEFTGTRSGETFSFKDSEGNELLSGKAAAGVFVYYRRALANVTYRHADAYTGEVEADSETLTFDGYGGATFTDAEVAHKGTIEYDPALMTYTFTYENSKEGFGFTLSEADGTDIFCVEGREAGSYINLILLYQQGAAEAYQGDLLLLDGYGIAYVIDADDYSDHGIISLLGAGTYLPRGDHGEIGLTLMDTEGNMAESTVKLMNYQNVPVWFADTGIAGEYTAADGTTLTLDSYGATYDSATYQGKDGVKTAGMYTVDPLLNIVRLIPEEGDVISFRVDVTTHALTLLGGGDYREYLRHYGASGASPVGTPVLTLGENDTATYGAGMNKIEGTVSAVEGSKTRFTFTANSGTFAFEYELGEALVTVGGQYVYAYYFDMYPVQGTAETVLTLTEKEGGKGTIVATLNALGSGDAVYTDGVGNSYLGVYLTLDGKTFGVEYSIAEFMVNATGENLYFGIEKNADGAYATFFVLGSETGTYYQYAGGETHEDVSLFLIQNGNTRIAFYKNGAEDAGMVGTYTLNKDGVGTVTCDKTTLTVLIDNDGTFTVHTHLWEGTKSFTGGGHTLTLDGFYTATYDGDPIEYAFVKDSETRIFLLGYIGQELFEGYFDIDTEKGTYTACGYEVGTYYDEASDDFFALDGYGTVKLYNITEQNENGTLKVLKTGTYTVITDGYDDANIYVRITYTGEQPFDALLYGVSDGEEITLFYRVKDGAAGTYKSAKWEFFTFNGFGDAYYTDAFGITYEGQYEKRSEHVYAFSSENLDGIVYLELAAQSFTVRTTGFVTDGTTLVKYLGGDSKDIVIPDTITKIADLAFSEHVYGSDYEGAAIASVDLKNVTEIGANAFNGCEELKSVTGAHVKTVGDNAFYACIELSSLSMDALETLGENAFHLCESLVNVSLPAAKTVYSSAFSDCHELETVSLPKAEKIYEGVFFDCFMLQSVTIGSALTQLGTADEHVAGVFERSAGYDQVPLTLILEGTTVPKDVCGDLFAGVTNYTVKVPTMSVVKAFYAAAAWAKYNPYVGAPSAYDGVYLRTYSDTIEYLVLDVLAVFHDVYGYQESTRRAYAVEDGKLMLYTFAPDEELKYNVAYAGDVDAENSTIFYDVDNYGEDYRDYYWATLAKGGKPYTMQNSNDTGEVLKVTFTRPLDEGNDAVFVTDKGVEKAVVIKSLRDEDQYNKLRMYFDLDGWRYYLGFSGNMTSSPWFSYDTPAFIPIVKQYFNDTDYLAVSQNDVDGTEYTVTFVLNGFDEPIRGIQVKAEKSGNLFTAKSFIFGENSYVFRFTVDETAGTFSYEYESERQWKFSADRADLVVNQNTEGELTSIFLSVDGTLLTEGKDYVLDKQGDVYIFTIYQYSAASMYSATFTVGTEVSCEFVKIGTVVKGQSQLSIGQAFLYFGDDSELLDVALLLDRKEGGDRVYVKPDHVECEGGLVTAVVDTGDFAGKYFVKYSEYGLDFFIKETFVYDSSADSDEEGTFTVKRDSQNSVTEVLLTIGTKNYTKYWEGDENFIVTDDTDYYFITFSGLSSRIAKLVCQTVEDASTDFVLTILVDAGYNNIQKILSATIGGEPVNAEYQETGSRYKITAGGKVYYLTLGETSELQALIQKTLTTADGNFRITGYFDDNCKLVGLTKFETMINGVLTEREITYSWDTGCEVKPSAEYSYESYNFEFSGDTLDTLTVTVTLSPYSS